VRSKQSLQCHKCGALIQAEDTAVIRIPQARFEERKHCCPNCSAIIAIEIGPSEDTQETLAALADRLGKSDLS